MLVNPATRYTDENICAGADIPHKNKLKGFLTEVCYSVWAYFRGVEYERNRLSRWNIMTLKLIMDRREDEGG